MILELASIHIHSGQDATFEASYREASKVIASAKGYIKHELQRSVDVQHHYMLFVEWQSLDDHVVGFRESTLFLEWRRLIGPFFARPPEVEHYEKI